MGRNAQPVIRISKRAATTFQILAPTTKPASFTAKLWTVYLPSTTRSSAYMTQHLINITPKPAEMKQEQYERTLKARAFDITRYPLLLATNTSLGEIVNARTLETQVAQSFVAYAQGSSSARRVFEERGDLGGLQREC